MRCFGEFNDDRICDLCKISSEYCYNTCKDKFYSTIELENKLQEFKLKCPYKTICFDERSEFDGCNKNGDGYGKNADVCRVCIECLEE